MRLISLLLLILAATFCAPAMATYQIRDQIQVDGQSLSLKNEPLKGYIKEREISLKPTTSANWRGYVAYWTLTGKELQLDRVSWGGENGTPWGTLLQSGDEFVKEHMPGNSLPVRATWYSGVLVIGLGADQVSEKGPYTPYEKSYARYLLVTVKHGRVVNQRTVSQDELNASS